MMSRARLGIKVKISNKAHDFVPYYPGADLDGGGTLNESTILERVRRTQRAHYVHAQLAITFILLAEKIEFVLLVTAETDKANECQPTEHTIREELTGFTRAEAYAAYKKTRTIGKVRLNKAFTVPLPLTIQ